MGDNSLGFGGERPGKCIWSAHPEGGFSQSPTISLLIRVIKELSAAQSVVGNYVACHSPVTQASGDGDRLRQTAVVLQVRPVWRSAGREVQAVERHLTMLSVAPSTHGPSRPAPRASVDCRRPSATFQQAQSPGRAPAQGCGFRLRQAPEIAALARAQPPLGPDRLRPA